MISSPQLMSCQSRLQPLRLIIFEQSDRYEYNLVGVFNLNESKIVIYHTIGLSHEQFAKCLIRDCFERFSLFCFLQKLQKTKQQKNSLYTCTLTYTYISAMTLFLTFILIYTIGTMDSPNNKLGQKASVAVRL